METSGSLTLDEIPAYTTSAQLTLSGHAAASAEIRVEESGKQLAKTGAKKDGSFSLKVKLADEGDHELVVTAGEDTATFTIRYEKPDARRARRPSPSARRRTALPRAPGASPSRGNGRSAS